MAKQSTSRLNVLRTSLGLSAKDVALAAHISPNYLSLLNGRRSASPKVLHRLSTALRNAPLPLLTWLTMERGGEPGEEQETLKKLDEDFAELFAQFVARHARSRLKI